MEAVFGWIRNLVGFFLFMSVLENFLPGKKYGKYVRLFSGMVFILLVLQPLTGSLRLEELLAREYGALVFRYEADDLREELLGVEKQRLQNMMAQYEEAVAQDVEQMARDMGYEVQQCSVEIEANETSEAFGKVKKVCLSVETEAERLALPGGEDSGPDTAAEGRTGESAGSQKPEVPVISVGPVDPVVVEGEKAPSSADREAEHGKTRALKQKITSYYELEDRYVEIQVVER